MGNKTLVCKYWVIYQQILFFWPLSLLVTIVINYCQQFKETFRNLGKLKVHPCKLLSALPFSVTSVVLKAVAGANPTLVDIV